METEFEIPEAIAGDEAAVKRYLDALRGKAAQDAEHEAEALKAFAPTVREIQHREKVKIDGARLSRDERRRLTEIVAGADQSRTDEKTGAQLRGWNVAGVDKNAARDWERLIEKGAGAKVFKQRREQAKQQEERARITELARKALRKQRPRMTEPGSIQLPAFVADPAWLGLQTEFGIVDVGVLALVVGLLVGHDGIVDGADGAEVHGDDLHIDPAFFPGSHLLYGLHDTNDVKRSLEFLAENRLLAIAKDHGNHWRISLGPTYLSAEDPEPLVAARRAS